MRVNARPTEELRTLKLNSPDIRARIWVGVTERGTPVELYVVGLQPVDKSMQAAMDLHDEVPPYFRQTKAIKFVETK